MTRYALLLILVLAGCSEEVKRIEVVGEWEFTKAPEFPNGPPAYYPGGPVTIENYVEPTALRSLHWIDENNMPHFYVSTDCDLMQQAIDDGWRHGLPDCETVDKLVQYGVIDRVPCEVSKDVCHWVAINDGRKGDAEAGVTVFPNPGTAASTTYASNKTEYTNHEHVGEVITMPGSPCPRVQGLDAGASWQMYRNAIGVVVCECQQHNMVWPGEPIGDNDCDCGDGTILTENDND